MRVLVVNAGSSSLKVDLIEDGEWTSSYDGLPGTAPDVDAVGHRIVHGGPDLVAPVVIDVIDRTPSLQGRVAALRQEMVDARARARAYTREHGEDPPEISDWTWPF